MIQIIGETTMYFKTDKYSMNLIQSRLSDAFEKFDVLDHVIYSDKHKLHIKFIMNMQENRKCKSFNDYITYVLPEIKSHFPWDIEFRPLIVHQITKSYQSLQPINKHMTAFINNNLNNNE
ncbi:MAG TPA: hypothetical protein VK142_00190 [Bacillota bacterium]|nr:hypothetical protein [Bacillota bacterium]